MIEESLARGKASPYSVWSQTPILFVFNEGLNVLPADSLQVYQPFGFQKLQEKTYRSAVQFQGTGASVPAALMKQVFLSKMDSRQVLLSELR
jgi:hypothetical protein